MLKQAFLRPRSLPRSLLLFAFLFLSSTAHANKYWVSTSTGNWNNTANWSQTSGGTGGVQVPVSTDSVVFDGMKIGSCTINTIVSVSSITISTSVTGGYTGVVIALSTITITTTLDFAISNGTFTAQSSTMTINRNMSVNGGIFTNAASSITVAGNWTNVSGSTFTAGTSTVTFNSSTLNNTITSAGKNFGNVVFKNTGSWVLQDSMTVTSTMTIANGTLDTSASNCSGVSCNMTVGGSWYNTGGSFTTETSTIAFTATTAAQKIKSNGSPFYNIQFNGAGGTWVMQDSMTVVSTITLTAGTLNTSASNLGISVGNSWANTGGLFTTNSSTVTFNGATAGLRIKSRGFPFKSIFLGPSTTGGYWTLVDSMTVSTMTLYAQNSFELAGSSLSISSFTNAGSFLLHSLEGVGKAPNNLTGSTVTFNATSGVPLVFSTWTYQNLVINGASTVFSSTGPLTINGNLSILAGALDMTVSNNPIALAGNWRNTGGIFTARSSTVTFTATVTGNTIQSNGSPFANVQMNGSGGYWTLIDSMTANSTMTITNGTLDTSASNCSGISCNMTVGGSWYNTGGIFATETSTIAFTATTAAQKIKSNGDPFYNIQFNGAGGTWVMQDSMTVVSNLTATAGTLNTSANNLGISIGSSWFNTGGLFTTNSSTVTFNGATAGLRIKSRGFPFKSIFLGPSTSGGYWTLVDSMTVSTMTLYGQNSFELAGSSLSISSFTNAGDFILHSLEGVGNAPNNLTGSTVTFNATSGAPLVFSTWTYQNLVINGASTVFSSTGPLTINGNLSILAGTLDMTASNNPITLGGNWSDSGGAFMARSSTVTFTATDTGNTIQSNGSPFFNVQMNGSGGYWTLIDSMTANSTMTITNGTLDTSASNCSGISCNMTVGGSWYNTGGIFATETSTIAFTATTAQKIRSNGGPYYNIQFNGTGGSWVMQDSMTVTHTIAFTAGTFDSNASLSLGISVGGNWNHGAGVASLNQSTVTLTGSGTSTLMGSSTFYSLSCTVPAKTITLTSNSTQTVTNVLTLTGSSGNLIQINSTSPGTYAYLNNTGSNNVTFVNAVDNNANEGITIVAGASSTGSNTQNWLFGSPVLSVTFTPKSYDFKSVSTGATTVSTSAISVANAGNTTETFSLSVATTGAQTVWGVGTTPPTTQDVFLLYAVFNSTQPASAFANEDIMISTAAASTSTKFSIGNVTGVSVPISTAENLWMRLDMPPTTSTVAQQQMTVTVTASYP